MTEESVAKSEEREDNSGKEGKEGKEDKKRCKKWCRGIMWTLLVVLVLIIVALAVAIIWLGPIVERYVEKHDKEYVGRHLTMDNLSIKLFKGEASVDNMVLYEADDTTTFVGARRIELDITLSELFDKHIHVTRVELAAPNFKIDQSPEQFNFDDLVAFIDEEYLDEDDVDDDEEDEPWTLTIENIAVVDGDLAYYDAELEQHWHLADMDITTPRLILEGEPTNITASMMVNECGALAGDLVLGIDTLDFRFDGTIDGFDISETLNYWTPYLNVRSVSGITSADCVLEGNMLDILGMDITGTLHVDNLDIIGEDGNRLLSTTSLDAAPRGFNIAKEYYVFDSFIVEGFASRFVLNSDSSTNFTTLFYGSPEVSVESTVDQVGDNMYDVRERVTVTTEEEVAPLRNMILRVGELKLSGGEFYYADHTMHEPFEYNLRSISLESTNFDIMDNNSITMRAKLPKQGSALLRWDGSLTDFYNQSLLAALTNVDMQGLSTYVEHFTAFPVMSGNMTFRCQNVVTNGEISGVNQLGTYNFTVGKRDKGMDVEFNLPLKLGVYLLTDKDDHIDVDLPITGNIDSPEFSYKRVIWRAIGNLLLKVAASPFQWMSPDKQDAFRHIDVDLLVAGLDSEHYARLDSMAEALKQDSTLKLRLTQRVNYSRAVQRLADLNLKIAYYNATEGRESGYLDMLDFARITDMRLSGRDVSAFADTMLLSRGIDPAGMSVHAKAKRLYGDVVDEQLVGLMRHRNTIIADYMGFQHTDMPAGAFNINDVVVEDIRNYTGKDRYTVTLVIDDEEVDVAVDDSTDMAAEDDYYDAYILEDDTATEGNFIEQETLEVEEIENHDSEDEVLSGSVKDVE